MLRRLLALAAALLVLLPGALAAGHPLGISSINRYLGVRLQPGEVEVDYLLDYAELPAWSEIETLDTDHDNAVTPAERERYLDRVQAIVLRALVVRVNGRPVALRAAFRSLEAPPGQNGLSTLRVAIELRAPRPATPADVTVAVRDDTYSNRSGWREMDALATPHGRVVSSSLPPSPRAGAGLAYPAEALANPPRHDEATFVLRPLAGGGARASGSATARPLSQGDPEGQRLAALLRDPHRSWSFVLVALGLAFLLGAGHALSPGHGKTLVAAYLVGSHGRPRHALALGATVTFTHTASVFLIGVLALAIEQTIGSDRLLRALELTAGLLVAGVALSQLPARVRRLRASAPHDHDHAHDHDHSHGHGHGHDHAPPEKITWRGLVAMGVSGGLVPCPGALVVLLTAIALHRVAFGLGLLVAFSLGLATVLCGLGLLFVLARRLLDRVPTHARWLRALPVASSCAVLALGGLIVVRALAR